jgi:dolichol-phosphate mannosyltransferase
MNIADGCLTELEPRIHLIPVEPARAALEPRIHPKPADAHLAALEPKIRRLQGPILVLGGSGFVGANLLRTLLKFRSDVFGTTTRLPAWRLEDLPPRNVKQVDLLIDSNLDALLDEINPRTVFNCVAYGAYSFETDSNLIYQTNFNFTSRLVARLEKRGIASYIHAGSSSEYGDRAAGPHEDDPIAPNSDYSVSKIASANLLHYYGKRKKFPCANLRLYSVYGPYEDSSRLIPNVIRRGFEGGYPEFVNPTISRDFVYIDDVTEAFLDTALNLEEADYGESFNIGTGCKTSIGAIAAIARQEFGLANDPQFTMPERSWDVADWFANIDKARAVVQWQPRTSFQEGLERTVQWYESLADKQKYHQASKKFGLDIVYSVSAIVACYKDSQAIPIMYERLKNTFTKLNIDFEIIFVNDCSPDDSEEVIRAISRNDRRVIGISHSRNFGSQAAFVSGMRIATKNACVLLDGDLQDPPELIEQFVAEWRNGHDVVFGRRVKREASLFMQVAYKGFYRVFDRFSSVRIPHDAGDFALMDKRVVEAMLAFPERDLFLRGCRAFAGFKQTGVDYVRPERMFGRSTNSLVKNLSWAKKGILSFSNTPLSMLSFTGTVLLVLSLILLLGQAVVRMLFPDIVPPGVTTLLLLILFFGSINLFAIGLVGEYIAKIFEEVKRRPLFIRRSITKEGEVRPAADLSRGDRP